MLSKEPKDMDPREVHKWLLSAVAPRPIAFVSTVSPEGVNNLSPYSFFNAFGSNPPVVAFSSTRRGTDASLKDSYHNIMATGECVINAVSYPMVEQVNLSSGEYPPDVDEFELAGFTPVASDLVRPMRVAESPFSMECKLHKMVSVGEGRGSANIAICEVVKFHYAGDVWKNGEVQPDMIDLVGRNGALFYTRARGEAIFELPRPTTTKPIGWSGLPDFIKKSDIYSANNLGKLAGTHRLPDSDEVMDFIKSHEIAFSTEEAFNRAKNIGDYAAMLRSAIFLCKKSHPKVNVLFEKTAKAAIEAGDLDFAWKAALAHNFCHLK